LQNINTEKKFGLKMLYCVSVSDDNMLEFIRDKTADPYFWNLVWFIGNHAIDLDNCAEKEAE